MDFLAELLRNHEARAKWLAECDPRTSGLYDQALRLIGGLESKSLWKVETLLNALGCNKRRETQLKNMLPEHLMECILFLEWITELATNAPADRNVNRELIRAASRMYEQVDHDLAACKSAMRTQIGHGDPLTPRALIKIGEVGTAFQIARTALPGPAGNGARALEEASPLGDIPMGHIRADTLDALLRYSENADAYTFSVERTVVLKKHITQCAACSEALDERASALGIDPHAARQVNLERLTYLV